MILLLSLELLLSIRVMHLSLLFIVHLLSLVMIIGHPGCLMVLLLRRILIPMVLLLLLLLIMWDLIGMLLVHGLARTRVISSRHIRMRRQ